MSDATMPDKMPPDHPVTGTLPAGVWALLAAMVDQVPMARAVSNPVAERIAVIRNDAAREWAENGERAA